MKKLLHILMALFVALSLCFLLASCEKDKKGGKPSESKENTYYSQGLAFTSNGDGTCYVSGIGTCTDKSIKVPPISPDGDNVTSIGEWAFRNCGSLTSIVIGDSVTSIGVQAFAYCASLTNIEIPDNVTYIDDYAFFGCTSLTSIIIPDSVTSIGIGVFKNCGNLTSIVINDGVTSIGVDTFRNCTILTDVYYTGTEYEWKNITIGLGKNDLKNATIHYNYVPEG